MRDLTRREALGTLGAMSAGLALGSRAAFAETDAPAVAGRLKQSISRWCYVEDSAR